MRLKLHEIMAKNNIRTIEELAKVTGLNKNALYWQTSRKGACKTVSFDMLETICRTFNCCVSEILVLEKI